MTGKERFIKQHWQSHGKKALQPIFNHLWDTDISYKFKEIKELGIGDKSMHSETVPVTGVGHYLSLRVPTGVPEKILLLSLLEGSNLVAMR